MYFDLKPKEKREDFYDFKEPLSTLVDILKRSVAFAPLIVVKGHRRLGKTSLIKTALNELKLPYLYIDGKVFEDMPGIKKKDLLKEIERGLNKVEKKWGNIVREFVRGVDWIKVGPRPPFINFEWRRRARDMDIPDLVYSFDRLAEERRTKFVLVLDEAQEFRRLVDYNLAGLLAYIFDNIDGVQIVVSGSQVGLLDDFLRTDDPEAPLFGRGTEDIELSGLSREKAEDFLLKGFRQAGIKPDKETIDSAVSKLDGTIGWLTLFGHKAMRGSVKTALDRTIDEGSRMAGTELEHFLKTREQARKRYVLILKAAVRRGSARWVTLKEDLEAIERKKIANNVFSSLLKNLVDADFLEKSADGTYSAIDPLLTRALDSGLVR